MEHKKRKRDTINENRKKRHKKELNFDEIKLINKQGMTRTCNENALIIQAIVYFQKQAESLDQSTKKCVEMFEGRNKEYHELWNYYINNVN